VFPAYPWRTACYPAAALLAGLGAAQIIATLQVYLSNRSLYRSLTLITEAGYLAIPNQQIMGRLQELAPAVCGGLFFTLSVGAGISLLSFAAAWVWDRLFSRSMGPLIFLLIVWTGSIAAMNFKGVSPLVTAYFAVIPALVSWITLKWMPQKPRGTAVSSALTCLLPIALLASLWAPQMEKDLFVNLRDRLLWSNRIGTAVSKFYYEYTLYPAQAFKSLDQKTLKTCAIDPTLRTSLKDALTAKLIAHDYLCIKGTDAVDLKIGESGKDLILKDRGRVVLKTPAHDFLKAPADILMRFSSKTDRFPLFRQFTYYGILIGFPVTLYLFLYGTLLLALTRFLDSRTASVTTAGLCVMSGVLLLIPLWTGSVKTVFKTDPARLLESGHWQGRVAALEMIRQNNLALPDPRSYQSILDGPHIRDRYRLAKALGVDRRPETYEDLLRLLDDPSPSVVCMAFQSLGRRGNPEAVTEIVKRIQTMDHWYPQWYAYRALKELGWKQEKSG